MCPEKVRPTHEQPIPSPNRKGEVCKVFYVQRSYFGITYEILGFLHV
jgi:hypothetical protein